MTQVEKTSPTPIVLSRIRLTYARREALRYVSQLDMQLVWERTLRRAGMPLAYSQGFNRRPRLHLGCALPLGFLSQCEVTDFWLDGIEEASLDLAELQSRILASTPPGLEIHHVEIVPLSQPALQTQVRSAEYVALPLDPLDAEALAQSIQALLEAASLPRERRGKAYDLRPLIEGLEARLSTLDERPTIWMRLSARESATGRPEEVLSALGLDPAVFRVERTLLILE